MVVNHLELTRYFPSGYPGGMAANSPRLGRPHPGDAFGLED